MYRIIQRVHVHQWILLKRSVNLTQNTIVLLSRDVPSRPLTLRRVGATSTINPKINQPRTNINNMIQAPSKCHSSVHQVTPNFFPGAVKTKTVAMLSEYGFQPLRAETIRSEFYNRSNIRKIVKKECLSGIIVSRSVVSWWWVS